jgi:hypothetical protein
MGIWAVIVKIRLGLALDLEGKGRSLGPDLLDLDRLRTTGKFILL